MQKIYTIQGSNGRPGNKLRVRIAIYPKDVEIITGRSHRTACRILAEIRKDMGKSKNQFVSIWEFCLYMRMDVELVKEVLSV
jgi:hypothetical protein